MVKLMMSDPDPKFQDSKFLSLVKKIQRGEVYIEKDAIIDNTSRNIQ